MIQKPGTIVNKYLERYTLIDESGKPNNMTAEHELKTEAQVPKLGLMMIGLGGNNGTTVTCGILANKMKLKWETKKGELSSNYYGSFTQCVTTKVGIKAEKTSDGKLMIQDVFKPIKELLPMVNPDDIVIGGWDINNANMFMAAKRAQVLEPALINQLKDELTPMIPFSGVFDPQFIASNQADRVNNAKIGTTSELIAQIRADIKRFRDTKHVDKVVVLWTANTEMNYPKSIPTIEALEQMIAANESLPPSVMYATAALKEHCTYLNGSPQNTLHPAIIKLAQQEGGAVAGADFKSGQTKYKTAMGDFLVGSGLRCSSVVSYNHLGNNDGKNLAEEHTFKSKEKSKSSCLDDCLKSNPILYPAGHDHIDHTVVIKYCPNVGDSKRAIDEYTSEIFMNGANTIMTYNVCEDSLLAAPIMIDLVILAELFTRISIDGKRIGPVLSYLSYFLKAPVTNHKEYVINSLSKQKEILSSFLKACAGYTPDDSTMLSFHFQVETKESEDARSKKT